MPILQLDDGSTLWECDAIVCKLARLAGRPEFFPDGEQPPELIRWLSWTAKHWGRATSAFYFQHIVVPRYRLPVVPEAEMQGYAREVARLAPILDAHLAGRTWMLGGDDRPPMPTSGSATSSRLSRMRSWTSAPSRTSGACRRSWRACRIGARLSKGSDHAGRNTRMRCPSGSAVVAV